MFNKPSAEYVNVGKLSYSALFLSSVNTNLLFILVIQLSELVDWAFAQTQDCRSVTVKDILKNSLVKSII